MMNEYLNAHSISSVKQSKKACLQKVLSNAIILKNDRGNEKSKKQC